MVNNTNSETGPKGRTSAPAEEATPTSQPGVTYHRPEDVGWRFLNLFGGKPARTTKPEDTPHPQPPVVETDLPER